MSEATDDEVTWTVVRAGVDLHPDGETNPLAVKFTSAMPVTLEDNCPVLQVFVVVNGCVFSDSKLTLNWMSDGGPVDVQGGPSVLLARTGNFSVNCGSD